MRDGQNKPLRVNFGFGQYLVSGHFSPRRSYLKMDLKSEIFHFFQTICFWKAETKLEMNVLEFLGSEVIEVA